MTSPIPIHVLALLLASPVSVLAASPGAFTLGETVPADAYIYIHGAYNPESQFVTDHWKTVWQAFRESGVIEDVHRLIATSIPQEEQPKFEEFWKKAGELIEGVDWNARIEEGVYCGRMGPPMPEYLVLLRYEPESAKRNAAAFAAVLREIEQAAGADSGVAVETASEHGAEITTLRIGEAPFLNIRVALRGPVVAIALDRGLLSEAFSRLADQPGKPALVETPRFKEAMAALPAPEDTVTFFDARATIDGVRAIMKFATSQPAGNGEAAEADRVIGKVLDEFAMFDYIAATVRTEGYQQVTETTIALAPDAERSRLYKVFKPEPIERFDRFIPKEATGYSAFSGFDVGALYAGILDFIDKEVAGGKGMLAKWEQVQGEIGFSPERDVFSWLGGQMVSVSLPAATPTPFSSSDSVLFVRVRDEKLAAEKVKAGLDRLNDFLTSRATPLTSQPASVAGGQGFRTVTHPVVMMFLRPVYGVTEGHLVIGTSAQAIEACLATARGERPGIRESERVRREGLLPDGPVASASFTDLSTLGRDIGQVLNMFGMIAAFIPDQPDTRPVRGVIGILGKLGPVVEKIDFIASSSSISTFDGRGWRTRSVTNYRAPKPETAPHAGGM